jgi:hypothetical protein
MSTATHIPTTLLKALSTVTTSAIVNFGDVFVGNFVAGVVTGTTLPPMGSSGLQFVGGTAGVASLFTANSEISYSGYARQVMSGITLAYDSNGIQVDWTFNAITFPQNANDPGTGRYGFIGYKGVGSNDASYPVVAVLDFGQTVSVVNGSLVLQPPAGGLIQIQGGG